MQTLLVLMFWSRVSDAPQVSTQLLPTSQACEVAKAAAVALARKGRPSYATPVPDYCKTSKMGCLTTTGRYYPPEVSAECVSLPAETARVSDSLSAVPLLAPTVTQAPLRPLP